MNKMPPKLVTWIIVVMSLILLELTCRLGFFSATILVAPSIAFSTLLYNIANGSIFPHMGVTFLEVVISFAIASVMGFTVGIIFWKYERLGKIFEPYLVGMHAVPLIFFYPLLLYIFGLGQKPIIYIAITHSTTPILLNTWIGLKGVKEIFLKVAGSVNCSKWQTYIKVVFPAATPRIFAGLKMGFIYAFVSCVAMEFILSEKGLGWMVKYDYEYFEPERMYGAILLLVIIAVSINSFLLYYEKRIRMEME
jgi:NitT/TauT family transport system permease protein